MQDIIRNKLLNRKKYLDSVGFQQFQVVLRQFLYFIGRHPLLAGIRDELIARTKADKPEEYANKIIEGEALYGETEIEAAALGYECLYRFSIMENFKRYLEIMPLKYCFNSSNYDHTLYNLRNIYLEPFYQYLDERIDNQQAILYLLKRYKHRCEWFRRKKLSNLVKSQTKKGEHCLSLDLYEFMYIQGVDFHIEPKSASGIVDFIADQVGDDRVVADVKIFCPNKGKKKQYIISGFNQVYTYAKDYNESCAYMIIYKLCEEDVKFDVPPTKSIFPCLSINNKTIFFIVIDIYEHKKSASKRGYLKSVNITEKDLIHSIENGS